MNPPDEDEVARRMPVWRALSELFLDTELQPEDYARIREALAASGEAPARLREMLVREVAPVLCHNLMMVAGEWAFWDDDELRRLLVPRLRRCRDRPGRGLIARLLFGGYVAGEWAKVDPGIAARG